MLVERLMTVAHTDPSCRFKTSQITNGLMFVQLGMGLTLTFNEIGKVCRDEMRREI